MPRSSPPFSSAASSPSSYGWPDIEIGYAPGDHIGTAYADVIGPGEAPPEGPGELWNSARESSQPVLNLPDATPTKTKSIKLPWPQDLPGQATAIRQALASFPQGTTVLHLAARFSKAPKATLTTLLETLTALGQARREGDRFLPA